MSFSVPTSHWEEASAFLKGLGYTGSVLESPEFRFQALEYLRLLLQKNQEVNLTGAKDLETAFWKHLVDSLSVLSMEPLGITADWGSGGGLPGIPLALARKNTGDDTSVLFVDSVGKKIRALEEFAAALELKNCQGFVGRGEELIRSGELKNVASVVMRAVAPPERAIPWLSSKIPNWIFFLGPSQREEWQKEIPGLRKKGLYFHSEKKFDLPRNLGERWLLRISKSST